MFSRAFCLGLAVFAGQSLLCPSAVYADQLSLSSGDFVAPVVIHEVISEKLTAGASHQIKATVTDNVGVKSVTLFYRTSGAMEYKRNSMSRVEGSDQYLVRLGHRDVVKPGIEYFLQATDLAGNTILHGYFLSPFFVSVESASLPESSTNAVIEHPKAFIAKQEQLISRNTKKWLWVGLGILTAGAIIANNDNGDPVTAKPDTGGISIDGPNP